jgi:hypothetical protein
MNTFDDLFEKCGGPAQVGRMIGVPTEHATAMKRRGSIPAAYWPKLISSAAEGGIEGISYEALARLAAQRRAVTDHRPSTLGAAAAEVA